MISSIHSGEVFTKSYIIRDKGLRYCVDFAVDHIPSTTKITQKIVML